MDTIANSSISLSWSVSIDSVVTSYEVIWISGDCPGDVDEGNSTTTATSYTIDDLRAGRRYNISVSATNSAGTSSSDTVTAETTEQGTGSCDCMCVI